MNVFGEIIGRETHTGALIEVPFHQISKFGPEALHTRGDLLF